LSDMVLVVVVALGLEVGLGVEVVGREPGGRVSGSAI